MRETKDRAIGPFVGDEVTKVIRHAVVNSMVTPTARLTTGNRRAPNQSKEASLWSWMLSNHRACNLR